MYLAADISEADDPDCLAVDLAAQGQLGEREATGPAPLVCVRNGLFLKNYRIIISLVKNHHFLLKSQYFN